MALRLRFNLGALQSLQFFVFLSVRDFSGFFRCKFFRIALFLAFLFFALIIKYQLVDFLFFLSDDFSSSFSSVRSSPFLPSVNPVCFHRQLTSFILKRVLWCWNRHDHVIFPVESVSHKVFPFFTCINNFSKETLLVSVIFYWTISFVR